MSNYIESSLISWFVMEGDKHDDWKTSYCADGDGIVQVIVYADNRVELVDQLEIVKTWHNVTTKEETSSILEDSQKYLAATYHEIYEDAMHYNNEPTTDELRQHMNQVHGFGHLDN